MTWRFTFFCFCKFISSFHITELLGTTYLGSILIRVARQTGGEDDDWVGRMGWMGHDMIYIFVTYTCLYLLA